MSVNLKCALCRNILFRYDLIQFSQLATTPYTKGNFRGSCINKTLQGDECKPLLQGQWLFYKQLNLKITTTVIGNVVYFLDTCIAQMVKRKSMERSKLGAVGKAFPSSGHKSPASHSFSPNFQDSLLGLPHLSRKVLRHLAN